MRSMEASPLLLRYALVTGVNSADNGRDRWMDTVHDLLKEECMAEATPKITAMENGPYQVLGNVPLVRKTPIKSDKGEAIGWQTGETVKTESAYYLCRCGASNNKPFCDGTHRQIGFDGTETAATSDIASRQTDYPGMDV